MVVGDLSNKPGSVRLSLHPTMTDAELDVMLEALHQTVTDIDAWSYTYDKETNEYLHRRVTSSPPWSSVGLTGLPLCRI